MILDIVLMTIFGDDYRGSGAAYSESFQKRRHVTSSSQFFFTSLGKYHFAGCRKAETMRTERPATSSEC